MSGYYWPFGWECVVTMHHSVDYLIVGSGLTGATIARVLADDGREVAVLERRSHAGGNVSDCLHPSGIRIHTYGPHYFRTDSEEIWSFVNRFSTFEPFEPVVKTLVDGRHENWPVAASYIRRAEGERWIPGFAGVPENFEEASLAMMPRRIYEKFVRGYTRKQWGVDPRTLSPSVAKRFDIRMDDEPRLMRHRYQGIPGAGYSEFMRSLLHDIPLILKCDYLREREVWTARRLLIFTGPIDEFFGFRLGRLKYRGQGRIHQYLPDVTRALPCGQVNVPAAADGPEIRRLEWKQMMPHRLQSAIRGTVITREITDTPDDPDRYEYPFPDASNAALYREYRTLAAADSRLLICGRLGEYRYIDMDQAITRGLFLARKILDRETGRAKGGVHQAIASEAA